jgi:hypothetical protein
MFAGYSKRNRKTRRTMRGRKHAGFGFTEQEHRRRAISNAHVARVESKVVRAHLSRGECAAAIRGLAFTGWALGKLSGDRAGARTFGRKKDRAPSLTVRNSTQLRNLADRVISVCRVPAARRTRRR